MSRIYYNDSDRNCVSWLRRLIAAGALPGGDVDDRPLEEANAADLAGYSQCHFFAGIGGWPLALELAGWEGPVWTGSCPCQPFSAAHKGIGFDDKRHLWPVWFDLIRQCKPATIFGEQVDGAIKWGWLDLVSGDLEGQGYAVGAAVLGACSIGAPHIRKRLYWVADTGCVQSSRGRAAPPEAARGRSQRNLAGCSA